MPILDLDGAAPLPGYKPRRSKRTFGDPGTIAPGLNLNGGGGAGGYGFSAAKYSRLTADFWAAQRSADQDLFGDNPRLRSRARNLALDNPFARKFLAMVVQNIVGPQGILMQARVRGVNNKETEQSKLINQRIEEEWLNWCEAGSCTADGKFSFVGAQQIAIRNAAREGENLTKFAFDRSFNPTGFALQLLDNDQLDDTLMTRVDDDTQIRMGVEVNSYLRPIAYHLWNAHPFDTLGAAGGRQRKRIPAEQIVHSFLPERPGQTRGYTWMAAAILSMNMYDGYNQAELVAARASAAKFGVIQSEVPEGYTEDEDAEGDATNLDGTNYMSGESGEFIRLAAGETLNFTDPKHPTQAFRDFSRTAIRNIASGLLVSYPSLGNDLEGVNFSSIRAGLLDERDSWRILQRWFIDHFCKPIFNQWLEVALLSTLADINLSAKQKRQFAWRARGWEWVDPLKDAQATDLRVQNGYSTYAEELGNLGRDFEETMITRAAEEKFLKGLGLTLGTDIHGIADTATDDAAATAGSSGGKGKGKAAGQDGGS